MIYTISANHFYYCAVSKVLLSRSIFSPLFSCVFRTLPFRFCSVVLEFRPFLCVLAIPGLVSKSFFRCSNSARLFLTQKRAERQSDCYTMSLRIGFDAALCLSTQQFLPAPRRRTERGLLIALEDKPPLSQQLCDLRQWHVPQDFVPWLHRQQ